MTKNNSNERFLFSTKRDSELSPRDIHAFYRYVKIEATYTLLENIIICIDKSILRQHSVSIAKHISMVLNRAHFLGAIARLQRNR